MSKRDYYEILGVDKSADKDTIKKAYRKLALKYHPDRNPDDKDAEHKFKECSEAAEILLNEEKKSRYDQFGHAGVNGNAGGGFNGFSGDFGDLGDIFGDIFGDILGGGRRRGGRRRSSAVPGDDLQMNIEISFNEAAFGVERKLKIDRHVGCEPCNGTGATGSSGPTTCDTCHGHGEVRRQQGFFTVATTCPKCQGSGQMIKDPCSACRGAGRVRKEVELEVKIPAGIDHGQRLKLTDEGDKGRNGGPSGDLYVGVIIKEHEFYKRDGFDVYCTIPVSFSQAALGADLEVPTLGGMVVLKVPAGTQSGKKMRLKAKGIQKLGGHGIGDQIVSIHVETPTKLNSEQRKLFEQLSKHDDSTSNPMSQGFFEKVKNLFQ